MDDWLHRQEKGVVKTGRRPKRPEDIAMKRILLVLLLTGSGAVCAANDDTAKAGVEAVKQQAAARYGEDQKLCAEESNSSRRMQCLRDAKEEYNRALAATETNPKVEDATRPAAPVCNECGKVVAVRVQEKEGSGSPVGVIAGGVVGGLLGNQIGRGRGRDVATIAGAAGGAYAGHKIEGKMNTVKTWIVTVRFDNRDERVFNFDRDPGLVAGDAVKASGNSVLRR